MNIAAITIVVLVVVGSTQPVSAQGAEEYKVKAAFLYNFAKFVEWPGEALSDEGSPIVIGIVGADPFGSALDRTIKGQTAQGRPLAVRRLKSGQDLKGCHILFISASETRRIPQILDGIRGSSILTVSEVEQFAHIGGIINFFIEQNKLRLEINVDTAGRARLKISSKLLSVAKVVRG